MSMTTALLTPLVLLLPAVGAVEAIQDLPPQSGIMGQAAPPPVNEEPEPGRAASDTVAARSFQDWPFIFVSKGFRPDGAYQVRIEQRMTIRIAPRRTTPQIQPNMFVGVPNQALSQNFIERKMGKCLPVKNISGVQTNSGDSILLFMRDRRVVKAQLERSCRARDFYSGFYLSNNSDGKLCVHRDELQSRSGANCKLTRIRQLVQVEN